MDQKDWSLLTALAEEKSLTKAAQKLYITQPAATRRLQQLEQDFGCRLIIRTSRGITLTSEGEHLARYAAEELERLESLRCFMNNCGPDIRGTVRLACASAYARPCLPRILKRFSSLYPLADVQVVSGYSSSMLRLLTRGDAHIAVARGDVAWEEEQFLLRADPLYYAVSADPFELEDLPRLPQIHVTTDSPLEEALHRWWTEHFRVPPRITTVVDRSDVGLEMVRQGLGYSMLSGLYIQDDSRLFRRPLVFPDGRGLTRESRAFCRKSSLQIRAVRALWDYLREEAGAE